MGRKWFEVKIFTSNHFQTQRKERQRSHPDHSTNPDRRSTSTSNRTQITPFDFTGEPRGQDRTPSTSPTSHAFNFAEIAPQDCTSSTSPTSHAFDFAEMALRRHWSHWDRDWEMVGFWWIWPNLINFFWLGFDEFDQICVYLLRNSIIYLFGNWENVRKCKKQEENVFSILFSGTQPNTWKYFPFLKIAFPENIYFSENILHEPNTACEINT